MVRPGEKLFRAKTLLNFSSKAHSSSFFQKTRFRFEFWYEIAPHLFYRPNGLDGAIGGKSVQERSFVHPKKKVFGRIFLKKPAPYLFSGPNWLYGGFGGKIVPDENFAQFCLKSPPKFVFPKNTFSVWIFVENRSSPIFLAKRTRSRDWGQKCPGAKFRPSQKARFQLEFFDETGPIHLFWAYLAIWCVRRQNCSGRKHCSILPQKPSKKKRFRFEFLY